jgi:hypothetical protein
MLDAEHFETRATEAEIAASEGHDLGCFEANAEKMIEEGLVADGELGEITTAGIAMEVQMFRELAAKTRRCECQVVWTAEEIEAMAG